jgi:hypothetical protein
VTKHFAQNTLALMPGAAGVRTFIFRRRGPEPRGGVPLGRGSVAASPCSPLPSAASMSMWIGASSSSPELSLPLLLPPPLLARRRAVPCNQR